MISNGESASAGVVSSAGEQLILARGGLLVEVADSADDEVDGDLPVLLRRDPISATFRRGAGCLPGLRGARSGASLQHQVPPFPG
jgi:hypothetical protein